MYCRFKVTATPLNKLGSRRGGLQCNDRRPVGFTDETVEDVQVFVLFLTPYRGLGIEQHRSSARRAEQAPLQYFLLFVFDEGKAKQEGTAP